MTFKNFSRLTNCQLLNTPLISSFDKVEINPKKVQRGNLFISNKKEDIELALHLEAYAIVSEEDCEIIDQEIAWFKTTSIDDVLIRLLKFNLLEKDFRFILVNSIEFELIQKIADKKHLYFLNSDEKQNYKKIINADAKPIFFSKEKEFLEKIFPEYESILKAKTDTFYENKNGLFLSSFIYKGREYKDIKVPLLFLDNLASVVIFLEKNTILFDIKKCNFTSHFHPVFINKNLEIKNFGKSELVIICESDKNLIEKEILYLKKNASWAKTIHFENSDILKLKEIEFNFAIITTTHNQLIKKLEEIEQKEQTLLF